MSCLLLFGLWVSCKKEQETVGIITVENAKGDPVHAANVRVYGDPSDTIYASKKVRVDKESKTDKAGQVKFNFEDYYKDGQSGLMVLDIKVKKDSLSAEDFIEIIHGEKNKKTVTLEP
ncbi:MAG: hypothetical protein ABEH38_02000 [Flavobacteriales bacterium]